VPTIHPIVVTADIDRLQHFYTALLGGVQVRRTPEDGPVFYVMLRIGDSELGLVADAAAPADAPQRMLLSVEVADVDALLDKVTELGGTVSGPPNDMPWGQRVAHVLDPDGNTVNLTQDI
jgi:predicted enzyme related to lactoylglutathione lyase